mgnify:CR=1 FL=1
MQSYSVSFLSKVTSNCKSWNTFENSYINDMIPLNLESKVFDNKVYHFKEAMQQSDFCDFIHVMEKEVKDHMDKGH